MGENLERLRELTNSLPAVPLIKLVKASSDKTVEYETQDGTPFFGLGLFNNGYVAVRRVFMGKGTLVPHHTHAGKEFMIVYSGKVRFRRSRGERVYGIGDILCFDPNEEHNGEALEHTWLIAITIPAEKGYPDG